MSNCKYEFLSQDSRTNRRMRNCFSDYECTCPVCGKTFIRAPQHMYTYKMKGGNRVYFCRYNHYVQWMKEHGKW